MWIQTSDVKYCSAVFSLYIAYLKFSNCKWMLCVHLSGSSKKSDTKRDKENLYWQFLIQIVVGHHRNIDIVHIYTVNIKKNDPIWFRLQYKWNYDARCWLIKWLSRVCWRKKNCCTCMAKVGCVCRTHWGRTEQLSKERPVDHKHTTLVHEKKKKTKPIFQCTRRILFQRIKNTC